MGTQPHFPLFSRSLCKSRMDVLMPDVSLCSPSDTHNSTKVSHPLPQKCPSLGGRTGEQNLVWLLTNVQPSPTWGPPPCSYTLNSNATLPPMTKLTHPVTASPIGKELR